MSRSAEDIDKLYLKSLGNLLMLLFRTITFLEDRLQCLKDPNNKNNTKSSKFVSDLGSAKDHHLFQLLTSTSTNKNAFEDSFNEQSIEANWVQRKIAPQTCAVNVEEKKRLVQHDELEVRYLANSIQF